MKFRAIFLLITILMFVGISGAVYWDVQRLFSGKMMIPTGSPWTSDDDAMYFGDGKDGSIMYDETTDDKLEIDGTVAIQDTLAFDQAAVSTATLQLYTAANVPQVILVDADSNNVTVTLPDAATVKGVPIKLVLTTAPGTNYLRINSTGGDLINGYAMYGTTNNINDQVVLMSNASTTYADYYLVDYIGTWVETFGA